MTIRNERILRAALAVDNARLLRRAEQDAAELDALLTEPLTMIALSRWMNWVALCTSRLGLPSVSDTL